MTASVQGTYAEEGGGIELTLETTDGRTQVKLVDGLAQPSHLVGTLSGAPFDGALVGSRPGLGAGRANMVNY